MTTTTRRGRPANRSPITKLSEPKVLEIIDLLMDTNLTYKAIGDKFSVSETTISGIYYYKSWKQVPRRPKMEGYVEPPIRPTKTQTNRRSDQLKTIEVKIEALLEEVRSLMAQ